MAHTESLYIAALTATPTQRNKLHDGNTESQIVASNVEWAPAADGDTLSICRIPVNAKILRCSLAYDDLASTSGTANLGFYAGNDATPTSAGTLVDEDALATALDIGGGAVAMTDQRYEVKGIETTKQVAWELAGLSAQPDYGDFTLALTCAALTGTQAGTVAWIVEFTL